MILALLEVPPASLKVVIRTYSLMGYVPPRIRNTGWLRYSGTVRNPGRGLACERTKRGEPSLFTARCWARAALLGTLWGAIKFSGIDWATGSATHALLFNEAFAVALAACGVCWCAAWQYASRRRRDGRVSRLRHAVREPRCAAAGLVRDGLVFFGRWRSSGCHRAGRRLCFGMGMLMLGVRMAGAYACVRAGHRPRARRPFVRAGRRFALCVRHAGFRVASVAGVLALAVAAACALPLAQRAAAGQPVVDDRRRTASRARGGSRSPRRSSCMWLPLVGAMIAQLHPGPCMGPGGFADRHDRRLVGPARSAWSPDRQWAPW